MFDDGVDDELGRFEGMGADEGIQFDVGIFEFDESQAQLLFDGFQFRRQFVGCEHAQSNLISVD